MEEVWKNLGFLGFSNYEVSNTGKVRTIKTHLYHQGKEQQQYYRIQLSQNGIVKKFMIHRLVALAFVSNPDNKPQVDHIDGNKHNNCVDNLRWVTSSENHLNPSTHYKTCGENHYGYQKSRPAEVKEKISNALLGYTWPENRKRHWKKVDGKRVYY